jgi:signal transduction histidine kinase
VLNQAKVVGILYLDNNLMQGTFTSERLEIVQILSSQIAISFENATLYKNLQSSNQLLQAQNERLRELDQIKDQFLANTSHELRFALSLFTFPLLYSFLNHIIRTPLNGIIGLAESMQDSDEPENLHNNLSMIVSCGKRLSYLVNDILDLSALKVGTLNIFYCSFLFIIFNFLLIALTQLIYSTKTYKHNRYNRAGGLFVYTFNW